MAAYALFLSICDLTHLFFINSFLFYLISIYRVIYHCSPQSARSSRLRIRAHPRRTGRAMAARIAKDLRAYPEVFFCFRWLSALHLLAEKAGDRLRELTLGFSGGGAAARGGKQHAAEHIPLGEDGRGHGHGVALIGLGDR